MTTKDKVGITFEVKRNIRQLDGVRMPMIMPDGWYWSYDEPNKFSAAHGPFPDCIIAGLDMAQTVGPTTTMTDPGNPPNSSKGER